MRHALLLFIDGIGLGPDDPAINPFAAARTPTLNRLLGRNLTFTEDRIQRDGALLVPIDATLGVEGLPQSATGQTALLTGLNAPKIAGRHITAYPTAQLKEILTEHNIFARVRRLGGTITLANAYTPEYFAAVEAGRLRHAAITFSALSAGVDLRDLDDLRSGRAVFHDLTNARLRSWGYDVREISPQQAGRNLGGITSERHLTVFEFFLTDLAAHRRIPLATEAVVEMVDALLGGVLEAVDLSTTLVLMVSDHGNVEDRRHDVHTRNHVPALLIGSAGESVGSALRSLTDITPALCSWISEGLRDG